MRLSDLFKMPEGVDEIPDQVKHEITIATTLEMIVRLGASNDNGTMDKNEFDLCLSQAAAVICRLARELSNATSDEALKLSDQGMVAVSELGADMTRQLASIALQSGKLQLADGIGAKLN